MDLFTSALSAIACASALFVITVLLFTRRRARRNITKLAQASHDIRADLERLRTDTNSKIAKLENEINQLRVEVASTSIQLVSLKTRKETAIPKIAASTQEDTWTRSDNLVEVSIVPTIMESPGIDTWVRNEKDSGR